MSGVGADAGRPEGAREPGELADSDTNARLTHEDTEMERNSGRRGHPVTPQGCALPPR